MACNNKLFVDMSQPSSYEELAAMFLKNRPVKGIVQPPIRPPKGKPHRNTNLLQFISCVVTLICKHPDSLSFRKPVDSVHLQIPDYHTIIRHPMDFYTIRRRIQNYYYYDVNECIRDIRLVFYNCYLYNKPDTEIVSMAKTLEEIFVKEMVNCPEKEVEIPIPVKPPRGRPKGGNRSNTVNVRTEPETSSILIDGRFAIQSRQLSAQSQAHVRPSSRSSDSSSSSNNYMEKYKQLNEKVEKLSELFNSFLKELNDLKKRRQERHARKKLGKELSSTSNAKSKIDGINKLSSTVLSPKHTISASTFPNNLLNKLPAQKQIREIAPMSNFPPKSAPQSRKIVHVSEPVTGTKKRKIDLNSRRKQPTYTSAACPPPIPVSVAASNGGCRMEVEDTDLKPMSYEEKKRLRDTLSKLEGNEAAAVITIIKHLDPSCYKEEEIEVDSLKPSTLNELQKYLDKLKKEGHSIYFNKKNGASNQNKNVVGNVAEDDTSSTTSTDSSNSSSSSSEIVMYCSDSSSSSNVSKNGTKYPDSTTSPKKLESGVAHRNPTSLFTHLEKVRHFGYTRITKRIETVEKKGQVAEDAQRFMNAIEKAKRERNRRFELVRNQASQFGNGEVKKKKEILND